MLKKILILGGTDGFGKWIAEYLQYHFKGHTHIIVTGRDKTKGEKVAQELGVTFTDDNSEYIDQADIVIFSVPIAFIEVSIKELGPKISPGAIVLDVCSVKSMPSESLKQYCPKDCLIIPTHPMFGPFISTMAGQVIVLTPDETTSQNKIYKKFKNYLESHAVKLVETSALEHDKMMAIVQGLTHFDLFVFGDTLKRLGFDINSSLRFVSPNYKVLLSFVARYLDQNPKLYSDIQMYNPEVLKVHQAFLESAEHYKKIAENGDSKAFVKTAQESQKFFGGENTKAGQRYTDKIIYLLGQQSELAKKSIGKTLQLRNIYDRKVLSGILLEFTDDLLVLNDTNSYHIDEWEILIK